MEMSAAEHNKCVSIFEKDEEEINEHPLALENGNADSGHQKKRKKERKKERKSCCRYSVYILDGIIGESSGLL